MSTGTKEHSNWKAFEEKEKDMFRLDTLTHEKYLANRLWHAYAAGISDEHERNTSLIEENKKLREALTNQLQTLKAVISGLRVVNLDEALAYYESLLSSNTETKP